MKRYLIIALSTLAMTTLGGCWWPSGPCVTEQTIEKNYDQVEIGMTVEQVAKKLGEPTATEFSLDKEGQPITDGTATWLRYNFDYPQNPVVIQIRLDRECRVAEKHYDTKEARCKSADDVYKEKTYPGEAQKEFAEAGRKQRFGY